MVIIMALLRRKNGAILIDAMLGIYLLAILGLMFAATTMAAVSACTSADQRTKATMIVNRELESLKTLGYGEMTYNGLYFYGIISQNPTSQHYEFANIGSATDRVSAVLPSGKGFITIFDVSATVRQVTVTVTWTSRTGDRSVSASTKLAELK